MAKQKRRKKRRLNFANIFKLILVVVLIIGGVVFFNYQNAQKPAQKTSEEVVFTVPSGSSAKSVIKLLDEQGIIKDGTMAYYYAKNNKLTDIKAGDYTLDKSWDLKTVLETINSATSAHTNDSSVTIIEGDWAKHIAQKISEVTNVSEDELLALWNDESYIRSLMNEYPFLTEDIFNKNSRILLEGYLAPNTYMFFKETSADEVTRKILDQSLVVYNKYKGEIEASTLSVHEIYTLASIVQYESGHIEDMKKIAQVFYNRLNVNMPLQSSVTVCYAIDINKNDDWMNCEVNSTFDSPYNTYQNAGLPPGPIENAGEKAIEAVLEPDRSMDGYYYFMADVYGDGTVYYAKTLDEHNANVAKYLR